MIFVKRDARLNNFYYRVLDTIPFHKSTSLNVVKWHILHTLK